MYNCLKMPTSRFRKLFASLFVFAGLCVSAQAATCYWIGGATDLSGNPDNNWSTLANWTTAIDGTGTTPTAVPGTGDTAYFPKDATVILDSDITVAEIQIPNPNLETISFSVELTGSHSITAATIETYRAAATGAAGNATSTLLLNCDVTSTNLIMHSGGNITLGTGKTASITNIVNTGNGTTPSTMLTVNGYLTSTSIQMSDITTRQITVNSSGTISAGSITGSTGAVTNNGLIVTQTEAASGLITGTGATTTAAAGSYVWTGATDANWTTDSNWLGGTAPSSASDTIVIPSVSTLPEISSLDTVAITVSNLTIDSAANITVNGTLNLTGDFDLESKINAVSGGTLNVNGELSISNIFSASNLAITCDSLTATNNLTCNSLSVSGATSVTSDSNLTLQTTGNTALSFGNSFTKGGTGNLSITSGGAITFGGAVSQPADTGNLSITSTGTITFDGTVTKSSDTGNLTITSRGAITFNDTFTQSSAAGNLTITSDGAINFNGAVTQSSDTGNLSITSDGTITFSDSLTNAGSLTINSADDVTFSAATQTATLTITATGKDVTFSDTFDSSTSVSVSSANLSFGDTVNVKDITMSSTTTTASNMNVTGNWTNNGSFTASNGTVTFTTASSDDTVAQINGDNTFANIEFQRNVNIYGDNTVTNNFTANKKVPDDNKLMGGRNILFASGKTLNVGGVFDLQGKAQTRGNRLRIAGLNPDSATTPWTLNWTGSGSNTIKFVSIKGCTNSGNTILTEKSTDFGGNSGFIFPDQEYVWEGTVSSAWSNINNWEPKSNPSKGSKIKINPATNHPILTSTDDTNFNETFNGTAYNGTITVTSGAIFDIAGQSLTLGKITNNGTVRLNGAAGQTITGTVENGSNSIVEYFDSTGSTAFSSFVWDGNSTAGKQYENLKISMPVSSTEQLEVSGTTEIAAGTGSTVSLGNSSNIFAGHITIGNSAASPQINAGAVTLSGTGTSGVAIYLENNIYADSLTLNNNIQGGTLTITAPLTVNTAAITTTGAQTYNNAVTLQQNVTFSAAAENLINFKAALTSSSNNTLTITNANSRFDGAVTSLSSLTTAATVTFNNTVNIGTLETQYTTIRSSCSSISTSGSQTYNKNVTISRNGNTTLTASNASSVYQTIQFKENILCSGTGTKKIILNANTQILNTAAVIEPDLQTNSGTTFTASAGTTTFKADVTIANGTLNANNGSINITAERKTPAGTAANLSGENTYNNLILQGKTTLNNSNTIANLTIQNSVTILADNTITNLTGTNLGGKIITFTGNTTQTITGTLNISGTSSASLLQLKRDTSNSNPWNISCTNPSISYVEVENSTSSQSIVALNSQDLGGNTNWNFPNMPYTWTGADSTSPTNWNSAANWTPTSIPGIGTIVTIPKGKTSYPELTTNITLYYNTTYKGKIIIESGTATLTEGKLYIGSNTVSTGEIENNGFIQLSGITNQFDVTLTSISNSTNSTVKYTGTGILDSDIAALNSPYGNLIINKAAALTCAITVTGTTTISAGSGNSVSLNNSLNHFTGNVIAGNSASTPQINAGALVLNASSPITIANNAYADSFTINCETNIQNIITLGNQTYNGVVNLTANASFTTSSAQIYYNQNINSADKTITLSSSHTYLADGVSVAPALINSGIITCSGEATFKGTVNNSSGTINGDTTNSKSLIFEKTYNGTGATLVASSGNTVFKENVNLSGTTFNHSSGTVRIDGTASNTVTISGSTSFYNFETIRSLLFTGSNNFTNFTAGTPSNQLGGKIITFTPGTEQLISGILTLSGNDNTNGNRIVLSSSLPGSNWKLKCTGSNTHAITCAEIKDSENTSSYYLFAINSWDNGNNIKWNFPNMPYTWTGADTSEPTNWNKASNWDRLSIPGKGTVITIPGGKQNYPLLIEALNLNDIYGSASTPYNGTILINEGAVFDLAAQSLTTGSITNNGTVRLTGAAGQVITGTMNNGTTGTASTVEYYGTGSIPSNFVWDGNSSSDGKQYANLILNQEVTQSGNENEKLYVAGVTKIISGSGKTVSLNNSSNQFAGHVIIGNSTATPPINAGTVILNGSGATSSAIYLEDNILADSLTLNSNVISGTLTVNSPLIVNAASINSTGNQTYNNTVTLSHDSIFTAPSGCLIHFKEAVSSNSSLPAKALTIENADSRFDNPVTSLSSLTTAATTNFNNSIIVGSLSTQTAKINYSAIETTTGGQTYNGPVTLLTNSTLKSPANTLIDFESTITGNNFSLTTDTGNSWFKREVTGLSFLTTAASTTFSANINIGALSTQNATINTNSITTTENQNYNGAVTVSSDTNLTAPADKLIHFYDEINGTNSLTIITAPVIFDGQINGLSFLTANQTATFNNQVSIRNLSTQKVNINTSSISTTGNQTYNNLITLVYDGNITLTAKNTTNEHQTIHFNNNINCTDSGTQNLIIDAHADINCLSITTTGFQNYKGQTDVENCIFTSEANITFDKQVTSPVFKLEKSTNCFFNDLVNITAFTDTTTSGNIYFNKGGAIHSQTVFNTPSTVSFGTSNEDVMTFGNSSTSSSSAASSATGPSSPEYLNITHTAGNTQITGTLNANLLTLAKTTGGNININAILISKDDFEADGQVSISKKVLLCSPANSKFGKNGYTITINDNLIITHGDTLTINAATSVNENLIIYNGNITAYADISVTKDVLLLGAAYSEKDNSTGIENEYAYNAPRHEEWSQPNYSETVLPDGNPVPASNYTGTLYVAPENSLTCSKNFYANGTTLSATLKLPDITRPQNGFAEAYHSVVSGCNIICIDGNTDSDTNGSKARLTALECTDGSSGTQQNINVGFEEFEIVNAYTVRDNTIRIEFNHPIRYHSSMLEPLKFHNNSSEPECIFTGIYSEPDCIDDNELSNDITLSYYNETDDKTYYYLYIKAEAQNEAPTGAWNTDASGKSASFSELSCDRDGKHHDTLPCLDFPRSLINSDGTIKPFILTDIWGKRLKNYSLRPTSQATEPAYGSSESSYDVSDKTGPVLWTVRTGQELHVPYNAAKGESSQPSYDAHNFLEFRYSEPVNFGSSDSSICDINIPAFKDAGRTQLNDELNIKVTDSFGAIKENIAQTYPSTLTFAGLAKIDDVVLYTGSKGEPDKYVNALYRTDEYSLRLSIAGLTEGTVNDYSGNTYKNWPGYIEAISQFTNKKVRASITQNPLVTDLEENPQIEYAANKAEPLVQSNAEDLLFTPDINTYGTWDISSPIFAPLRFNTEIPWTECISAERSEAVGNTNGSGSTLDRIEFHLFDNTPLYNSADTAEWFTEIGWCFPNSSPSRDNLIDKSYTYCSDIIGGSRQFDTDAERRTSGGIRFSSKLTASVGFLYSSDSSNDAPQTPFKDGAAGVQISTSSPLFTGSSSPRHPVNDADSLYLGLGITDTNLPVETTFSFSYNEQKAFVTDLAGNRLRSKTSKTIDRTPPAFDIVLSPVGSRNMFIIFVKPIVTDSTKLRLTSNNGEIINISQDFLSLLPDCFQIISIDSTGHYEPDTDLMIDTSIPAKIIASHSNENFTTIQLSLNKEVTLENVRNLYVQLKQNSNYPETSQDPFTSNKNSHVSLIQDSFGNYMGMYSAHAISDLAVNSVIPLYAYASDMQYGKEKVMDGLYGEGSWAVHDWNADQKNYGTLPADHTIDLVADSSGAEYVRLYLTNNADKNSISTQFNSDFSTDLRIWLPELKDGLIKAFTASNNTNYEISDSTKDTDNSQNLLFNLTTDIITKWNSGDQISFVFGIQDSNKNPYRIYNAPYYDVGTGLYKLNLTIPIPLFCIRMKNPSDLTSLDLWSFRLKDIINQRGGITILNNVINAAQGEKTVIKVQLPEAGKLNVAVLTLDGNIITYLNRGPVSAGEHYFTWNGKNQSGTPVARGMYFIRVTGNGIDETRKVMVIKN